MSDDNQWERLTLDFASDAALIASTLMLTDPQSGAAFDEIVTWLTDRSGDPPPAAVSLALASIELVAVVHRRWARGVGLSDAEMIEAWQMMVLDLAAERG